MPTSYTGNSSGPTARSGMRKSPTPKTHRSRCLFLVAKISFLTPMSVNFSPVLVGRYLTPSLYSVLPNTSNRMVSIRACCIPPNIPTVKRFLEAQLPLIRSWTGSRNASKRPPPCSIFVSHSSVPFISCSLCFSPRATPVEFVA